MCQQPPAEPKPKVRIVISLFGGVVDVVSVVGDEVEITDVIFLEDKKYGDMCDDEYRVKAADGRLTDAMIYSHHTGVSVLSEEEFTRIAAASQARVDEVPQDEWEKCEARQPPNGDYRWTLPVD